ncbi:MAG: DUF559 domain-containing protein [Rhodospirillales bacterium]|nr:DUF559 domain-containing protein [Rhodospirillales bacterium]
MREDKISNARRLRRDQTDAESKLWRRLREHPPSGARFRRQHPIGPFFADFVCVAVKLIVELDGGQHDAERDADLRRTRWLESSGWRVLRFWNTDVIENVDGVIDRITAAMRDPARDGDTALMAPPPHPPRR